MRRKIASRCRYLVVAGLSVTLALSLFQLSQVKREREAMARVISELTATRREYLELMEQLQEYERELRQLQERNKALEQMLFHRARTYRIVTERLYAGPAGSGLPSRWSGEGAREPVTAVTMPVKSRSGFTAEDFEKAWRHFKASQLEGTGAAFIKAEEDYGINALVLAAIVVHESNWGNSSLARTKNNLAGLGAYDGSPYRSAITFSQKAESIYFLAELLDRHYLTPGGKHYNGPHLAAIGKKYASDPRWAIKVAAKMKQLATVVVEQPAALLAFGE
ncbi:MAG TPA: glucosaminidase domain-containing protein [Bacillota bacterium]|nr:hypothetical protein [Bacillota bacterium]HOB87737.1 glucosaminidase domain-containing protein [Bacillota bacterium]HOP69970.1 glucosaminidase domain-containing protein [Bacillota bacterium]HPT33155.1 glucosaminidase domain-containing protein [Bacillota bacterium]HPZ65035.1 glucosaminidase domain-containing protein [Bacillota bacterium]